MWFVFSCRLSSAMSSSSSSSAPRAVYTLLPQLCGFPKASGPYSEAEARAHRVWLVGQMVSYGVVVVVVVVVDLVSLSCRRSSSS